jgi:hypothetical protein
MKLSPDRKELQRCGYRLGHASTIILVLVICDMDPLSVTASIIAILQLTGTVIGYLNEVKDAPKECQRCMIEASNNQSLLMNLRYRLEQGRNVRMKYMH